MQTDAPAPAPAPPWLSVGLLSSWLVRRSIEGNGPKWFAALSTAAGAAMYYDPSKALTDQSLMLVGAPIWIFGFAFALMLLSFVSTFGEITADLLMKKLFAHPDPRNPLHQITYMPMSIVGFVIAAYFVSMGVEPL